MNIRNDMLAVKLNTYLNALEKFLHFTINLLTCSHLSKQAIMGSFHHSTLYSVLQERDLFDCWNVLFVIQFFREESCREFFLVFFGKRVALLTYQVQRKSWRIPKKNTCMEIESNVGKWHRNKIFACCDRRPKLSVSLCTAFSSYVQ